MTLHRRIASRLGTIGWAAYEFVGREAERRTSTSFELPKDPVPSLLWRVPRAEPGLPAYRARWPERVTQRLAEADRICEHVLEKLGSGPRRVSAAGRGYRPIDWHADVESGYRWNRHTLSSLIRLRGGEDADVLVAWKLSRMQHLVALAQGFALSPRPKYVEEFKYQITDWIASNRTGRGVNWMTAMDAALRAISWLVALELFAPSGAIRRDRRFLRRLYRSLREHALFIQRRARLRKHRRQDLSNHYVASLAGLLGISVYCPFFAESAKWRSFAIAELLRSARRQVLEDGWDHEASTSYHALVLECFFWSLLLCERAGIGDLDPLRPTVERMFDVILDSVKSNGHTPQIGDNDSGRVLPLTVRPSLDRAHLLTLAAAWSGSGDFRLPGLEAGEEVYWIFGEEGLQQWAALPERPRPDGCVPFPDAGWHVIREGDVYAFLSCGPNGLGGLGGHAHNDKLSLELRLGDVDVLVDPGSPVYGGDPRQRNEYRSTRWHNTYAAHGCEQNRITENLFLLEDRVEVVSSNVVREDARVVYRGEIRYGDVTHRRRVAFERGETSVVIKDEIDRPPETSGVLSFHLAPGLRYRDGALIEAASGKGIARLGVEGGELRVEGYLYSPGYGERKKAERVLVDVPAGVADVRIETVIRAE